MNLSQIISGPGMKVLSINIPFNVKMCFVTHEHTSGDFWICLSSRNSLEKITRLFLSTALDSWVTAMLWGWKFKSMKHPPYTGLCPTERMSTIFNRASWGSSPHTHAKEQHFPAQFVDVQTVSCLKLSLMHDIQPPKKELCFGSVFYAQTRFELPLRSCY